MGIGRKDTPLAQTPEPDYRNIKTTKRVGFKDVKYTPTAKDTSDYRAGFKDAVEGKGRLFPSTSRKAGYKEAKQRGLSTKK